MEKYDLEKLYIITKHIAENDSISEQYGYYKMKHFEGEWREYLEGIENSLTDYINSAKELMDLLKEVD